MFQWFRNLFRRSPGNSLAPAASHGQLATQLRVPGASGGGWAPGWPVSAQGSNWIGDVAREDVRLALADPAFVGRYPIATEETIIGHSVAPGATPIPRVTFNGRNVIVTAFSTSMSAAGPTTITIQGILSPIAPATTQALHNAREDARRNDDYWEGLMQRQSRAAEERIAQQRASRPARSLFDRVSALVADTEAERASPERALRGIHVRTGQESDKTEIPETAAGVYNK